MEENIRKLMGLLKPMKVNIRPHLKTTKSPILAQKLVDAGATGGCVAKLSEAEVMAEAGFDDLLITCEIVGPVKVRRLVELFRNHRKIQIVVDSEFGAVAVNKALSSSGIEQPIQVLIDLDVGLHRTGVAPESALALAQHISRLSYLKLIGIQGYEGHLQHVHGRETREAQCRASMAILTSTASILRKNGFDIQVVTTGGTGTAEFCATTPGITEVQPGSFIFMDSDYYNAVGGYFSQSLTVLSTVISKSGSEHRVTIDAGLKSLPTDSGFSEPKNMPGVTYTPMGDEHGWLSWDDGPDVPLGARVEMIPSHIDPTVNLHDCYYAHRKGVIEEIWPVATRGKVQ
ncbi:putative amino acid aldolase or racemase [Coleophoma crateriformis]|uniref:Putative amino acid aldolase or racemase n=1 Tax=Coleophoma crateriformis TaxID=565419 RepID=A0A3D8SXB2_9HELO|nr:putative amino acid aldolase or racemase [Coleophoma crateriformis]